MYGYSTFNVAGPTGLTKQGASTLQISGGNNTYTGVTTLSGGTLSVSALANGGLPSDIGAATSDATNLVFDGGTLDVTGGSVDIDRLFTLSLSGGTIAVELGATLNLTNTGSIAFSGAGARTLTLSGSDTVGDTLAAALTDNGGPTAVTKTGTGTWMLTGNNTHSGPTTISQGNLQIGNGGSTGSIGSGPVTDNGRLTYNRTNSLTISSVVSGTGSVAVQGGTAILSQNNTYSGGTTITNGTLQVGTGGSTGSLYANGGIQDDSLLIFNTTGTFSYTAAINGSGNVIVQGNNGKITSLGGNNYTGWTRIDSRSTFQPCQGNQGSLASSVVTNNGTLLLVRQDNNVFIYSNSVVGSGKVLVDANNVNAGDVTLAGNCSYSGGTFIADNGLVVDNGSGTGWITGDVTFQSSTLVPYDNPRTLTFNRPDNVTFAGNIVTNFASPQSNLGIVVQNGTGVLTLTGTNTYGSGTTITTNGGTLQVGNGGTSGTIGTGPVTDNGFLVFNRSDNVTFGGNISGRGSVVQSGSGTLTLTGQLPMAQTVVDTSYITNLDNTIVTNVVTNVYLGTITVSNGTLVTAGGSMAGNVNVKGGTLAAAPAGIVGTLKVGGDLDIAGGTIVAEFNTGLAQPNTFYSVTNAGKGINATGGTLKLINNGPNLAVNQVFHVFSGAVTNGNLITIDSSAIAGTTFENDLAVDGSVKVLTAPVGPNVFTKPTGITSFAINGLNVVMTGTNGESGAAYYLRESTNVALPLSQWLSVATNVLSANGNYTFIGTNVVTPGSAGEYYILSNTNN